MTIVNGPGISGLEPAAPIGGTGSRQGRSASGFSVPAAARGGTAAAASEAPAVMLSGLLALQAEDSGDVQDREARRHGLDLLAELAALQRALLTDGAVPGANTDDLRRLARLAASLPAAADPRLAAVLEAIVLRARVELARLGA
jgi:hypothetical protein